MNSRKYQETSIGQRVRSMGKVKASLLLLLLALSPRLAFAEGDMVATLSNLEDYYLVGDPVPGG